MRLQLPASNVKVPTVSLFKDNAMNASKSVLSELSSKKLMSVMAAAGAATSVAQNAEAIDFYNSGPITTSNVVGLDGPTFFTTPFKLNLDGLGGGASFNGAYGVVFKKSAVNANVPYFRVGTYTRPANGGAGPLVNAAKTFAANDNWLNAGANIRASAKIAATSNGQVVLGQVNPVSTNRYLLFQFKDTGNANTYNGWVNIDFQNYIRDLNGLGFFTWAKINSYAWQAQTTGLLGAGQTAVAAVPEPSTIVTSGIAALAGGAMALRRWRKERKTALVA
jgi:hypothetical protein